MQTEFLTQLTLPELVDLIEKDFIASQEFEPKNAEQLYMSSAQPKGMGNTKRFDEFDTGTYAENKDEGANSSKGRVAVGYNKTMTMVRRSIEIDITWEMDNNGKKEDVVNKMLSLKHYGPERKELDLTHRFSFATETSYTDRNGKTIDNTGGDGKALVYSAHTLKYSSETWRNRITNDPVFATGALTLAEQIASVNTFNNFGEVRDMNFNIIFSGKDPETRRNIRKALESTGDVDEVNSSILNTYTGYRQVILPKLATDANGNYDSTKRRWWGIVSSGQLQAHYREWEANNLKTPNMDNGTDFSNDNMSFGQRMAYGICFVSAKGLIMSCPTS